MSSSCSKPALYGQPPYEVNQSTPAPANTAIEFGRFCVLPCKRQLQSDGLPVQLGSRAYDLLKVLLEADGSLVT